MILGVRIRLITLAIGAILLFVACTTVAYSSSIIVDPAGGAGIETSISAAIARASDGDTIIVHSGTYNGTVHVNKRLTLTGIDTGGERPLVDCRGQDGIEIFVSNVLVQGFSVRNATVGILIEGQFSPSVTGVTVLNNKVYDIRGDAIHAEFTDGNNITGNMLSNSSQGILLYSSNETVIADNTIFDMIGCGIGVGYEGNEVTGNTLYRCHGTGINLDGRSNVVAGNIAYDNGIGIDLYGGSGNYLTDNIVYRNDDGFHFQNAANNVIKGNTIYENTHGLWLTTSRNNDIRDNIFRDNVEAIHSDSYLDQNTISNNTIIGTPTMAVSTPKLVAGKDSAGGIIDALAHYGLIIGIAIIALGI
jgi:nitrous oxidase accessory protein